MPIYLTALNPTDAVTHGLLSAARRLGVDIVLLTDHVDDHLAVYGNGNAPLAVIGTDVRDAGTVAARVYSLVSRFGRPDAVLSNSDHLQTATALAAELLGLPGKLWQAALRCKNKFLTRRALAHAGLDVVPSVEIGPGDDAAAVARSLPFPAVVKPREGVASEDVSLVADAGELLATITAIRAHKPNLTLVAEEYIAGPVRTYETLGDATSLHHFGSWRTTLGPPPRFTEDRLDWDPALPAPVEAHLRAQLGALGVGFGACHTEFVADGDRARIIEVNYRLIGDTMDLITSQLLGVDLFAELIKLHLGEPLRTDLPDPSTIPRHGRVDYVLADRDGTLIDAPGDLVAETGGVLIGHRRLRAVGVTAPRHGTNRDYLSVVHGIGPDEGSVDSAIDGFLAGHKWVIA